MIVYFDSSALVKLVLEEEGSDVARELWEIASRRAASEVTYAEVRAALAAAHRGGRLDGDALTAAVANLDDARRSLHLLGIDADVAQRAGDLAERHALRGYDAVQLATALGIEAPRVVAATWDRRLGEAASRSGLGVVPSPPSWDDERAGGVAAGPLETSSP